MSDAYQEEEEDKVDFLKVTPPKNSSMLSRKSLTDTKA